MSPSWLDALRARPMPGAFQRTRLATLVLSPAGVGLAGPGLVTAFRPAALNWSRTLELADSMLPAKPDFTALEVILAGTWGRCLLGPALTTLPSAEELDALARQVAAEAYGQQALTWTIRTQLQGRGMPPIISVVETAWLENLAQLAAARQLKLHAVSPLLAACWNRSRRQLPARADWFALAEPGRVQLLALKGGQWAALSSTRCETEGSGLATLLHREAQFMGRSEQGEAWVYAAHAAPHASSHWRWNLLVPKAATPFAALLEAA